MPRRVVRLDSKLPEASENEKSKSSGAIGNRRRARMASNTANSSSTVTQQHSAVDENLDSCAADGTTDGSDKIEGNSGESEAPVPQQTLKGNFGAARDLDGSQKSSAPSPETVPGLEELMFLLPSLSKKESNPKIFERLSSYSGKSTTLEFNHLVDEELSKKQSAVNSGIWAMLRSIPKHSGHALEATPDFIDLRNALPPPPARGSAASSSTSRKMMAQSPQFAPVPPIEEGEIPDATAPSARPYDSSTQPNSTNWGSQTMSPSRHRFLSSETVVPVIGELPLPLPLHDGDSLLDGAGNDAYEVDLTKTALRVAHSSKSPPPPSSPPPPPPTAAPGGEIVFRPQKYGKRSRTPVRSPPPEPSPNSAAPPAEPPPSPSGTRPKRLRGEELDPREATGATREARTSEVRSDGVVGNRCVHVCDVDEDDEDDSRVVAYKPRNRDRHHRNQTDSRSPRSPKAPDRKRILESNLPVPLVAADGPSEPTAPNYVDGNDSEEVSLVGCRERPTILDSRTAVAVPDEQRGAEQPGAFSKISRFYVGPETEPNTSSRVEPSRNIQQSVEAAVPQGSSSTGVETTKPPWMAFLGFTPDGAPLGVSVAETAKRSIPISNSSNVSMQHNRNNPVGKVEAGAEESPAMVLRIPYTGWRDFMRTINSEIDFFGHLHEEICALLFWLDTTPEELLLRQRVLARVTIVAKELWPNAQVFCFGSYYTGLWLPNGDMDISISGVEGNQISNLRRLTLGLTQLGMAVAVEVISSARVPIVKFIDSESGISVDVSFNTDSGMTTSEFVVESMRNFPWLRPLIMFMKLYLQQRRFGETYKGGIGSYLLFVMCLSFLQHHPISYSPDRMAVTNLGHLVLDFLQLYGHEFNYYNTVVSVRNGGAYYTKGSYNWFQPDKPDLLAVESPLAPHVDLGRNSYDIQSVRNCFQQSFMDIVELCIKWNRGELPKDSSLLGPLIFTADTLMLRRLRHPVHYCIRPTADGTTTSPGASTGVSSWWVEAFKFLGQPISSVRAVPQLPPVIVEEVRAELEKADFRCAMPPPPPPPSPPPSRRDSNNNYYYHNHRFRGRFGRFHQPYATA